MCILIVCIRTTMVNTQLMSQSQNMFQAITIHLDVVKYEATEDSALQVKTYTDKSKSRFPVRYKCTDVNLLIILEYNFLLNSCTLLCSLSILSSCSFDLGKSLYHKLTKCIYYNVHCTCKWLTQCKFIRFKIIYILEIAA